MSIAPPPNLDPHSDAPLDEPSPAADSQPDSEASPDEGPPEPEKPPYIIEGARSGRARCKTCRKTIDKGALRIGVLVVGPYGPGHMWHHLRCAAGRLFDKVEEAYQAQAWQYAAEKVEVPSLDSLRALKEKSDERKATRKRPPYAERAPSARSTCKHCGEGIEQDAWRIVMGREVQFGNQVRTTPINVLPAHVAEVLAEPESATRVEEFAEALERNSGLSAQELDEVLAEIGALE